MVASRRYRRTYSQKFKRFGRRVGRVAFGAASARYGTSGGLARLAGDVAWVKSRINSEAKFIDLNATAAPGTATIVPLNLTAQGLDEFERIGRSIRMASVQSNLKFNLHGSATQTTIRCILFLDKANNGAGNPGATDLLVSSTPYSLRAPDEMRRFQVLKSFVYTINTDRPEGVKMMYRKLPRHLGKVKYNGTTAATTGINNGALYWLFVSDETTNAPTISYNTRVRYIDN